MKTFGKALLSYFDIITDILVLVDLIKRNSRMAVVQGISLGISFMFQSAISMACGQPAWVILSGLMGLIFASFLTTGFVVASSDREFDQSKFRRKSEPLLFGYVPETNSHRQMVAFVSFFSLYKLAKVSSLALLISASSFRYAIILLDLESFGFLGWRIVYGNWRFYRRGLDGIPLSLFNHFICYICLLSAPFPLIRVPTILSPRIYAGGLLYMLSSNLLILGFSYRVFDASAYLSQTEAWAGLSAITFLCLISGVIALHFVPESHKATFYKSRTFKEHVATYWWNECRYDKDHNHKITTDQQYIRARIPTWVSKHYTPDDKIVAFYKDHWKDWCANPPDWFDEELKSLVPEDLLAMVDETGSPREEQKEEA